MTRILMVLVALAMVYALVSCEKKQNAELTYTCAMNGYGSGSCTFTNTKEGTGSQCGKVTVKNTTDQRSASSAVFCSGKVDASSSKKVDFLVTEVREICETDGSWTKVCDLTFVPGE